MRLKPINGVVVLCTLMGGASATAGEVKSGAMRYAR